MRLEDTDKKREVAGADQHIMDSLGWLGLVPDEGPAIGGQYAPYRQSERLELYKTWAQKLIDSGRAYADPYTPAEVQTFREQAQHAKQPFLYRNHRPDSPPAWDGSQPLRFKSDPKAYQWHDKVMGDLSTGPEVIDDFILIKSDGYPTYNFCHIVDDAQMQITHIIRGQEFLASVPNYLNLYEALDLKPPIMATMPHILGDAGTKKLSKRDGAKDILDYRKEGFLPEAMINFLASLGWNDGTEQEVYSVAELIKKFSLDRVGKSGARFDEKRLVWLNGAHIRTIPVDKLYELVGQGDTTFWPPEASSYPDDYKRQVLGVVQERLKFFHELPELTIFFFKDLPVNIELIDNNKQLKKFSHAELKQMLERAKAELEQSDFSVENLTQCLNDLLQATGQKPGVLFSLIRIATTQAPASPSLAETLAILGRDTSLRRLDQQLTALA